MPGIDPCDLRDGKASTTLETVKQRLAACTGNLIQVHEAIKDLRDSGGKRRSGYDVRAIDDMQTHYGPFLDLVVEKATVEEDGKERVVFSLTGCELQPVQ